MAREVLFAILKDTPDMLRRPATRLPCGLVEPDEVVAHSGGFGSSKRSGKDDDAWTRRSSRR